MSSTPAFDVGGFVDRFEEMSEGERNMAWSDLSNNQKKKVKSEQATREKLRQATALATAEEADESDEDVPMFTPSVTVASKSVQKGKILVKQGDVSEEMLREMWTVVDGLDVSTIDSESLRIFEYVGFNPDAVLRSLMGSKIKNGVKDSDFKTDILVMCGLAVIKGSVNANNFKKMSQKGQDEVLRLESLYGIKRGSGRGEPAETVTVSRIAAAFPGKIMQLIVNGKVSPRKFTGPCKSNSLPGQIRHQSFAAVIPMELGERSKEFLLAVATGFSVDQSITINPDKKRKPDPKELYFQQRSFTEVAHNSGFPRESVRKAIFRSLNLNYDSILSCAQAVKKIDEDLIIIDKSQFSSDLNAL
jgi:hypothetical protein